MKKKKKTLVDVIRKSEVALINKMEDGECENLAGEINAWLNKPVYPLIKGNVKVYTVEELFDIDKDEDSSPEVICVAELSVDQKKYLGIPI